MKKYVLGFAFSSDGKRVVLIEKTKPEFLKGLWNGVGGKIEEYDETPAHAMEREFWEETGVKLTGWSNMFFIDNPENEYQMWVYFALDDRINECRTTTEEKVSIVNVEHLDMYKLSRNVQWFIHFVLSASVSFKLPINVLDQGGD